MSRIESKRTKREKRLKSQAPSQGGSQSKLVGSKNSYELPLPPQYQNYDSYVRSVYKNAGLVPPSQNHLQLWANIGNDLGWKFWLAQAKWSRKTFGSDKRRGPLGPIKHLLKEITTEILPFLEDRDYKYLKRQYMLHELVDCFFLIIDATRRTGFTYDQFMAQAFKKLEINKKRKWNKPTTDEPVEHIRKGDSR